MRGYYDIWLPSQLTFGTGTQLCLCFCVNLVIPTTSEQKVQPRRNMCRMRFQLVAEGVLRWLYLPVAECAGLIPLWSYQLLVWNHLSLWWAEVSSVFFQVSFTKKNPDGLVMFSKSKFAEIKTMHHYSISSANTVYIIIYIYNII